MDYRGADITDHSGTLTTGGTAQTVMPANPARNYLLIQNVSDITLWINFGVAAVASQPSISLPAGAILIMDAWVTRLSVSIIGATTGKAFVAKEG